MKRLVYNLGLVALLGAGVLVNAQAQGAVGINTESPNATLEITPTGANALETAETNEGIIIPKLTKTRVANIDNANLVEGTLVYVTDKEYSGQNAKVAKVTEKGFYYYDGNEWIKAGGSKGATLNAITGNIRVVEAITPEEWKKPNTFALVQTSNAQIKLPNPADYTNKIIAVNNQYNNGVTYFAANSPENASALVSGKGHLLMSNGEAWYIIGGSY